MKYARANITGGKEYPEIKGCVFFKETTDGVLLTAQIKGLPQSNDSRYYWNRRIYYLKRPISVSL